MVGDLSPENRALVMAHTTAEEQEKSGVQWRIFEDELEALLNAARNASPGGGVADDIAKAICRERCAAYGDPPCWSLHDVVWDGGKCDNLHDCDCASITRAVLSLAAAPAPPSSIEGSASIGKEGGQDKYSSVVPLASPSVTSPSLDAGSATPSEDR